MDAHRKTFEECVYEHEDLVEDMVKMFAPGKDSTAHSRCRRTLSRFEDYFNRVVRRGVYPVLVTGVREYRSDAGVDEARNDHEPKFWSDKIEWASDVLLFSQRLLKSGEQSLSFVNVCTSCTL